MEPGTSEWPAMMNRLERLEKQNRSFKQIGTLGLILIGSVLLMGQASPKRTVEANEFVLKDSSARIRGRLSIKNDGPMLELLGNSGETGAVLAVGADGAGLSLGYGNSRYMPVNLTMGKSGPDLNLNDATGHIHLSILSGSPSLELLDKEGFITAIGGTDLKTPATGETHKTSAASVVLFDKDKKVLWKAP